MSGVNGTGSVEMLDEDREVLALGHLVSGEEVSGGQETVVLDAPDASAYCRIPQADEELVGHAVSQARQAFREWRRETAAKREAILRRGAEDLLDCMGQIASMIVRETGKPIRQAEGEVARAAATFEEFASATRIDRGSLISRHSPAVWGLELREPLGVAAVIGTWNLPLQIGALKISAALAAGCTVVAKSSPLAPQATMALAEALYAAGLPNDCLHVLHGDQETSRALVSHPNIAVVSFTGRESSARAVMSAASDSLAKPVMELGGKSANIVFGDADLDRAIPGLVAGFVRNQGATCTAGTRILVERQVFDEVVSRLTAAVARVRVGDPYLVETEVGAIRTRDMVDALEMELEMARSRGAEQLTGGGPVVVKGRTGGYLQPAVLTGVTNQDPLCRRELFGPVAVVLPFEDEQDAVEQANDSVYGLAAGIWSSDSQRVERVWGELDVGTVYVNSYHRIDGIPLPAGGRKASGFGLEVGLRGLDEFMTSKSVHIPRV